MPLLGRGESRKQVFSHMNILLLSVSWPTNVSIFSWADEPEHTVFREKLPRLLLLGGSIGHNLSR